MVTFDNEVLFESGTSRFLIGPIKLRHAVQNSPGSVGARLDAQGVEARQIKQVGELLADDPSGLQAIIDSIKQKMDGFPHLLTDNLGRDWPDTVMAEFEAGDFVRVGARWKTVYTVKYWQVKP